MQLGKPVSHPLYGWDNEYGKHVEKVKAFSATKYLISNGEFLKFVEAGGYERKPTGQRKAGIGEISNKRHCHFFGAKLLMNTTCVWWPKKFPCHGTGRWK